MSPKCLDVRLWRSPTKAEMLSYIEKLHRDFDEERKEKSEKKCVIAIRNKISPVDMYSYLKCRFGEPNGFQTFIRKDDGGNLIHWDYNLKADNDDVYVCGHSREIHIAVGDDLSDSQWRDLIVAIKADFGRVGREKSSVLKTLERWVIFPNRFTQLATICADLHADIHDNIEEVKRSKPMSGSTQEHFAILKDISKRATNLYRKCTELSLMTPILAEAFINMIVIILCKREIRDNERQFEAFIRSHIDTKIFDLAY
jgi:hypothetical protein